MHVLFAQITETLDPIINSTTQRSDNTYLVVAMMVFCVIVGAGLITFVLRMDIANKSTQEKLLDRFGSVIETQRREFTAELQAEREERSQSRLILIEHDLFHKKSHSELLETIKELDGTVKTLSARVKNTEE